MTVGIHDIGLTNKAGPQGPGGNVSGSGAAKDVAYWTNASNITGNADLQWDNVAKTLTLGAGSKIVTPDETVSSLGGGGTQMVVADNTGVLSAQPIPGGAGGVMLWSAATNYVAGDLVIDRGGTWQATGTNTNSEPISGNANWMLKGGTPYVDLVLNPNDFTAAPYYDPTATGPGVVLLGADATKLIFPTQIHSYTGNGNPWGTDTNITLSYDSPAGKVLIDCFGINSISDYLPDPSAPTFWSQGGGILTSTGTGTRFIDGSQFPQDASALSAVFGKALVAWSSTDPSIGGTVIGTRSMRIRVWYQLLDVPIFAEFFTISGVNQGTKTFTVSPDPTGLTGAGSVVGSTGNNGAYTVASVTATTIVVNEAIPNAIGDGWFKQ